MYKDEETLMNNLKAYVQEFMDAKDVTIFLPKSWYEEYKNWKVGECVLQFTTDKEIHLLGAGDYNYSIKLEAV